MSDDQSLETEATELLRTLIRNACVNDGTPASGHEDRNCDAIEAYFAGSGLRSERYSSGPGRISLITRIEGRDPSAPTLLLMGHTDVVPANPRAGSATRSEATWWTVSCGAAAPPTCCTSRRRWRWPRGGSPRAASRPGGR